MSTVIRSSARRGAVLVCVVGVLGCWLAPPALAVEPPTIDPRALVRSAPVAPAEPTEQRAHCARGLTMGSSATTPAGQAMLNLPAAWRFSRGAGQKVAVIDTGVTPHPRLGRVIAGGDYVSSGDGLSDCDAHGTVVAGIIAGKPSARDGFAGVAPESTLISIRQSSGAYSARSQRRADTADTDAAVGSGYGTVRTLAYAVVRAVELGATVINISEVACSPASESLGDRLLGAAVRHAYLSNVVVVVAAGNLTTNSACRQQNSRPSPSDARGWDTVSTVASPAWFAPYVLTVGAVDATGSPAQFSLHGPWLGVAAPGTDIVGPSSTPGASGLIDALPDQDGNPVPIRGTSFAAPYVAGTVALVRARYPELDAAAIIDRITRTAHGSGNGHDHAVGYGVIDPVAALTAELPDSGSASSSTTIAAPAPVAPPDHSARNAALIGIGVCTAIAVAAVGIALPNRRVRRLEPDEF